MIDIERTAARFNRIRAMLPRDVIRREVISHLVTSIAGDEEKGIFPEPADVVEDLVLEHLQEPLTDKCGPVGRVLARRLAKKAGNWMKLPEARFLELLRLTGERDHWDEVIAAEVEYAMDEMVKVWWDTLAMMVDESDQPSGQIRLGSMLFPSAADGDQNLSEPLPSWISVHVSEGAENWKQYFEMMLSHVVLSPNGIWQVWVEFVVKFTNFFRGSGEFYVMDEDNQSRLGFQQKEDGLFFVWEEVE